MSGLGAGRTDDQYLEAMRAARDRAAVLKIALVELRSRFPDIMIFVFEGIDDKIVYYHWVRRVSPGIVYEALPCGSKRNVLRLREVCARDMNDLSERVYYFIDRDFDDFGNFAKTKNTFMTDYYSVENYLVSDSIFDDILTNEFHCHARPEVRQRIRVLFGALHESFLLVSRAINFRIFVARKLQIDILTAIPDKLNKIFVVNLTDVTLVSSPESIIRLHREPESDEIESMNNEFGSLEPSTRYRGKFLLKFFLRWLELLADEYAARKTDIFQGVEGNYAIRRHEFGIGMLAARSHPPSELATFLCTTR
jgi:hypothetical protein